MNGPLLRKVAVACAVTLAGVPPGAAQQDPGVPPGVYTQTFRNEIYLEKESGTIDLPTGQAGFADARALRQLSAIPSFLANDRTPAPGLAGTLRGCGVFEGSAPPVSDQPLQSDFERFDRLVLDEIDEFLDEGYPPASVLMHAASKGVSINRAVYAAIRSQPGRADELYKTAVEVMAFLPGWTCTAGVERGLYEPLYDVNDLPEPRRVQDVAQRYFDDGAQLARFPDWPHDEFHLLASADELLELLSRLETAYWYRPGPRQEGPGANSRDGVLIGLYAYNDQIVIDTTADRIRRWKEQGRERIPVTFFYNFDHQRPVSRLEKNDAPLENVMDAFFSNGIELAPVPLWTAGDHHLKVAGDELEELFEIPETGEIDAARYRELADDLAANGFTRRPAQVTLLRSASYRRLAETDRIRVALDRGIDRFPVVVFYHHLGRDPCGAPATCFQNTCSALVCAGAPQNACIKPAAASEIFEAVQEPVPAGGGGSSTPAPPPEPPPPPPPSPASPS